MPTPNANETEQEFVNRCTPIVLAEGTTNDPEQAAAICHSKWDEANKGNAEGVQKRLSTLFAVKGTALNGCVKDVSTNSRTVTGVLNAYNFVDSYGDVLIMGAAKKSINENGPMSGAAQKIMHAKDHNLSNLVGRFTKLEETTKNGITGIHFESVISKTQAGNDLLMQYQEGIYNQHSIGFQYKDINLVKADASHWSETISGLINKDVAEANGYVYMVKEIALFEGSTVAIGANALTPFLGVKSGDKKLCMLMLQNKLDDLLGFFKHSRASDDCLRNIELQAMQIKQMLVEISEMPDNVDIKEAIIQRNIKKDFQKRTYWSNIASING